MTHGPWDDGEVRSNFLYLKEINKSVDVIFLGLGLKVVVMGWRLEMLSNDKILVIAMEVGYSS